jgi:hypothetical protein
VDQLAIGQTVQASGGADTLNPQAAVLALLDTAIAERVTIRAIGGFLSGLVELALSEEKAFCPFKILLTPSSAFSAAFYAWHGFSPSNLCNPVTRDEGLRGWRKTLRPEGLSYSFLGNKKVAEKRGDAECVSRNGFVSGVICSWR